MLKIDSTEVFVSSFSLIAEKKKKTKKMPETLRKLPNPLYHQHAYHPYCFLYISKGPDKENLVNNPVPLRLTIIPIIPMTLINDSAVLL